MKNTINVKTYIKGISLAVGMLLIAAPDAHAQFGKKLGGLKKKLGGGLLKKDDGNKGGGFKAFLGQTVDQYTAARINFINAQLQFAEVLGLRTKTFTELSESKRLLEGASSDPGARTKQLKDSVEISNRAEKELDLAMKEAHSKPLNPERAKEWFIGMGYTVRGGRQVAVQGKTIKARMKSGSPLEIASLRKLGPLTVRDGALGVRTLAAAKTCLKKQKIEPLSDKEAEALLP
jgi:hypothetical protein